MSTLRERLQQAATHAGVGSTQAAIADALGKSRQAINKWFIGTAAPSAENLLDISRKWGVSADWLQNGEGDMLPRPSTTDALSTEERELLRSYRSATPQTRQLLRTVARAARKSVVAIAAVLPPFMAPSPSDAATLHNYFYAPIVNTLHIVRRWLRALSASPNF